MLKDTGAPVILKIYQSENQLSVIQMRMHYANIQQTRHLINTDVLSKDNTE